MRSSLAIIITTIVLTTGCGKSSPTEPERRQASANCTAGCDGTLKVPPHDQTSFALAAARDAVRSAVESGQLEAKQAPDWNDVPRVDWQACFFWVDDGYYVDGNGNRVTGGACAAGMTDYAAGRIVIATQDPNRTIPLVKWETANYFLIAIGRSDLCDRWQAAVPM